MKKINKWIRLGGILIVFAAVQTSVWYYGASQIEQQIIAYQQMCVQRQQILTYENMKISGFPGSYVVRLKNMKFYGPVHDFGIQAGGDLVVTATSPELKLKTKLWTGREFHITTKGRSTIEWGLGPNYYDTYTFEKIKTKVSLNRRRHLSAFEAKIEHLVHKQSKPFGVERIIIYFRRGAVVQEGRKQPMWFIKTDFTNLVMPESGWAETQTDINLDAMVIDTKYTGGLWRALKAWRDDGGVIELKNFCINREPSFNWTLKGTITLDQDLRPLASLQSDIRGYSWVVDHLVKKGMIAKSEAAAAKIALTMLAKTEARGGNNQEILSLPIVAQDGRVSIGPLVLSPLPSLISLWPKSGSGR